MLKSFIGGCALSVLCLATVLTASGSQAQTAKETATPAIVRLDQQRYAIGKIVADKQERSFSVPGQVIELGAPEDALEFLAVGRNSYKTYESLLQLDANAFEFNLACILIGLKGRELSQPKQHFDPQPIEGDRVAVWVSWRSKGQESRVPATELLRLDGASPPTGEWVYTGSSFASSGEYLADLSGTLVGFVHDLDSIIHHRTGLGLGRYGAVQSRVEAIPPAGTSVELIVQYLGKRE